MYRLGFSNLCTIEAVKEAYPLLDMVDHTNRVRVAGNINNCTGNPDFPKVDGKFKDFLNFQV